MDSSVQIPLSQVLKNQILINKMHLFRTMSFLFLLRCRNENSILSNLVNLILSERYLHLLIPSPKQR